MAILYNCFSVSPGYSCDKQPGYFDIFFRNKPMGYGDGVILNKLWFII